MDRLVSKLEELATLARARPIDLWLSLLALFLPILIASQLLAWLFALIPAPVRIVVLGSLAASAVVLTLPWFKGLRQQLENQLKPWIVEKRECLSDYVVEHLIPRLEVLLYSRNTQLRYITLGVIVLLFEAMAITCGWLTNWYVSKLELHVETIIRQYFLLWASAFAALVASRISLRHYLYKGSAPSKSTSIVGRTRHSLRRVLASDELTFGSVITLYFFLTIITAFYPNGVGEWLTNWLIASTRDANLIGDNLDPAVYNTFSTLVKSALAVIFFFVPLSKVSQFAAMLCSMVRRSQIDPRATALYQALIGAVGIKTRKLIIKPERLWLRNSALTFWWVLACYLALFGLGMFYAGHITLIPAAGLLNDDAGIQLDRAIQLYGAVQLPELILGNAPLRLQLFVAAVFALFGTAPFAVMTCAFLPSGKPSELVMSSEGLLFPSSYLGQLLFRPLRAWSDVESVKLLKRRFLGDKIEIRFKSGGAFRFNPRQFSNEDLDQLLSAIDEYSDDCFYDNSVLALRRGLPTTAQSDKFADNRNIGKRDLSKFKSTIFTPLASGESILDGKVRIVRQIASRPLSAVYLVRTSSRLAVLKQFVIPTNSETNLAAKKAFERECELLRSLDHPQIVKILDVFKDGDNSYLLIEHAKGQDLFSLVAERGARSETIIIDWAMQICTIMNYLHSQSPTILHRDLTPDNIVVDEAGQLHLIDFGAANQFMEGVTGTLIGKQSYIAPEQLRGKANPRSDIYSFGGTLYYLLTGKEPRALAQCNPKEEGYRVSQKLNDLITQCTEFEDDKRLESFAAILATYGKIGRTQGMIEALDCQPIASPIAIDITNSIDSTSISIKLQPEKKLDQIA